MRYKILNFIKKNVRKRNSFKCKSCIYDVMNEMLQASFKNSYPLRDVLKKIHNHIRTNKNKNESMHRRRRAAA